MIVLDIETTGLDPASDCMLEIAAIHVTDDLMQVISDFTTLIKPEHLIMDDVVSAMHTNSGLLDELTNFDTEPPLLVCAEKYVLNWLGEQGLAPQSEPMVGSTIGFDRGFLKVYMPTLEEWFHYRNVDVSTVKELVRRWRPEVFRQAPPKNKGHRGLDDCYETLEELRFYKRGVFDYLRSPQAYGPIARA